MDNVGRGGGGGTQNRDIVGGTLFSQKRPLNPLLFTINTSIILIFLNKESLLLSSKNNRNTLLAKCHVNVYIKTLQCRQNYYHFLWPISNRSYVFTIVTIFYDRNCGLNSHNVIYVKLVPLDAGRLFRYKIGQNCVLPVGFESTEILTRRCWLFLLLKLSPFYVECAYIICLRLRKWDLLAKVHKILFPVSENLCI